MLRARDNPFTSERVLRERYRLDASGWALLFARLRALKQRGAIVGLHGSGKTTLLEDLSVRLDANGWRVTRVMLTVEHRALGLAVSPRRLAQLGPRDVLLLDGAEQLSVMAWWLVRFRARRAGGLIITTHVAGRLPTFWRCCTTPALLLDLSVSLGVPLAENDARDIFARHGGNLRNALRELYDRHGAHAG